MRYKHWDAWIHTRTFSHVARSGLWVYRGFKNYLTLMIIVRSLFKKKTIVDILNTGSVAPDDIRASVCIRPLKGKGLLCSDSVSQQRTSFGTVPLPEAQLGFCGGDAAGQLTVSLWPSFGAPLRSSLQLPSRCGFIQPILTVSHITSGVFISVLIKKAERAHLEGARG